MLQGCLFLTCWNKGMQRILISSSLACCKLNPPSTGNPYCKFTLCEIKHGSLILAALVSNQTLSSGLKRRHVSKLGYLLASAW